MVRGIRAITQIAKKRLLTELSSLFLTICHHLYHKHGMILLLSVAYGAGLTDNGDTDLTWVSHLVLDTLSNIK